MKYWNEDPFKENHKSFDPISKYVLFLGSLWVLFWISVVGGLAYVAYYFISKFW